MRTSDDAAVVRSLVAGGLVDIGKPSPGACEICGGELWVRWSTAAAQEILWCDKGHFLVPERRSSCRNE